MGGRYLGRGGRYLEWGVGTLDGDRYLGWGVGTFDRGGVGTLDGGRGRYLGG